MSRPISSTQRSLTLTEELEKLEQSITLTLQEIDHNFSRAHRIVTTNILPIVEQYAEQSKDVWEGSKFWKQFFEASANVSLSGYEEQPPDDTEQETTITEDTTETTHTTQDEESESYATPSSEHLNLHNRDADADEDIDFSALTLTPSQSHSTPRVPDHHQHHQPHHDNDDEAEPSPSVSYESPYEALRQEVASGDSPSEFQHHHHHHPHPTTPGKSRSKTPDSSPFLPPAPSTTKPSNNRNDPVLHRVLDKTYRVQATPLTSRTTKSYSTHHAAAASTTTPKTAQRKYYDSSPLSSPEIEVPKLHEEIFSSPLKQFGRYDDDESPSKPSNRRTPKPGISVLTPGKGKGKGEAKYGGGAGGGWDSDDDDIDDDEMFGSPPKTMQFHVPQSRLLKTPGTYLPYPLYTLSRKPKEASKRIVSDLLQSARGDGGAGEDITSDYEYQFGHGYDDEGSESPSVVRRAEGLDDESF
ncbi:DASH complex subunit ask1 [Arachnomyces sp. PD_36]|nr:DASH complex subunit ask1 [Arachnomyces sp. PD_36]